ncbi:AAA family ATPase [Pseudalkalibacillus caeni]|uniref:MoxR family ATPase n=1 Tax=Exobacillus caeni TaxID=2574798 RepID=A0A5R9F7K8_9BACL|nr:MoxR family ATPase [Pseudalkalibacillus caeni]TLS38240.1 MoxR family ATPase [Pseudalkalibacillus caeni]
MSSIDDKEKQIQEISLRLNGIRSEISRFIVGQEDIIDQLLWTIVAGGHALLEGLPGLGKTMLVRTISDVMDLTFSRVQFTPDLMPSDITGTMMIQPGEQGEQRFVFHKGPLFASIVLADEINRATPKTQSSLLEAMQEKTVTAMGEMKQLPSPFFVLATQNPIELEGTYPLPEAQMDRFLLKISVHYPTKEELKEIAVRTTGSEEIMLNKVADGEFVLQAQSVAKEILVSDQILDLAASLIMITHPDDEKAPESVKTFVRYGAGPRGLQSLLRASKARALFEGRYHVSVGDIKKTAIPVLRHRVFLNFEGEAAGISTDQILEEVVAAVTRDGVLT